MRARAANDQDRYVANLELSLSHYRESARIYRAIGHVEKADEAAQVAFGMEELLR